MKRVAAWLNLLGILAIASFADAQVRHEIVIPDLPGYRTLKCDLHMHTVFSDGVVWPTVRVDEAWRTGLDAISLTDHIEYQPHAEDLPTNFNRPYEMAAGRARERDLLFTPGTEITRDTPPGHFNAIFLNDVQPLAESDLVEVMKRANAQGGFVFWNHHEWKGPEKGAWFDIHTTLFDQKLLHGIEVANGETYYPQAHRWCLEKNLTMIGTSDIHEPDLRSRNTADDHRTMNLVFATERSLDALQDALRAGRTAVWYQDRVIGRSEWLEPLFHACVSVDPPHAEDGRAMWVKVRNRSDLALKLTRTGGPGPESLELPPQSIVLLKLAKSGAATAVEMACTVDNFLVAPDQGLPVVLKTP